ncbi:NAD(P)-dependent oxidoreductase [Aquabacterium sp.]|uniref:NAD-dependent epimerase/dehydratase family protein n=1 Tax=Aquabacterium sp. TaxID=1872578 RepID=UPI0025C6D492|nr:NAD(P)-dependent oxidoreductase [Aquabacterium sp.]
MKVLITGSGGFLGKRIAESILRRGAEELRLHFRQKPPQGMIEGLRQQFPNALIEVAQANLLARDSLQALVAGTDCIVHAAAGMRGAAADMFANTVVATRNLLDAATAQKIQRIVLISSFSVYHAETLAPHAVLDEATPIESVGVERGAYGYAKTRQEHLFLDYQKRFGFESVILRPGVIYGPGGGAMSSRVGINALGFFFSLGGRALLPLTYVDNCADAVAQAALKAPSGSAFNVVDDDLPTCNEYLKDYRQRVQKLRCIPVPHWAFMWGSKILVNYHRKSKGQLPAVFTPYVVNSMYRPLRYTNAALKAIGWQQRVSTAIGLTTTFQHLRSKP